MSIKRFFELIILFFFLFSCNDGSKNKNNNDINNHLNNINNGNNNTSQPIIYSVMPDRGPLAGNTEVMIYGDRFAADAVVYFGDRLGVDVVRISAGQLAVVTPAGTTAGPVDIRVVQESGEARLVGGFTYEDVAQIAIGWCRFQAPIATTTSIQMTTELLYGRVFAESVTQGVGRGAGITAQVGYGARGSDPRTDASWVWVTALFSGDVDDGANDEYVGNLLPAVAGEYDMAFRFSGGGSWVYCDTDGSDNGYSSAAAAHLTVTDNTEPMPDWCQIQYPPTLSGDVGVPLGPVYGRVYKAGVTQGAGAGAEITAQLGYGPLGTNPASDPGWQWVDATYNTDVDQGANDEYQARMTLSQAGKYAYAYRFSYQGGPPMYCDLDGSQNGYQPDKAGVVNVSGTPVNTTIDWCNFQYPAQTTSVVGQPTTLLFGRVYINGVTLGAGQGPGVMAQVGYGPLGTDPVASSEWNWEDATYNVDVDGVLPGDMANDEYMGTLTISTAGTYDMAYRFSRDGGNTWTYCDRDGSTNGYAPEQAAQLTVTAQPEVMVDWCVFHAPTTTQNWFEDIPSPHLYGRVYVAGVTDGPGQGPGITGEFGYGPYGSDPSTHTWTWTPGNYGYSVDGLIPGGLANDEYVGSLTIPSVGHYSLAVRFSRDGGNTWTYCDRDGSQNGVQVTELVDVNVVPVSTFTITSVFPNLGPLSGGQTITLTGAGFAAGMTVTLGSADCTNVQVVNSTQATCVTPPYNQPELVHISASLGTDNATLPNAYRYVPYMTPQMDGQLLEWSNAYLVATNHVATNWGTENAFRQLYFAYDDTRMYFALDGEVGVGNAFLLYIDTDIGSGTGIRNGTSLNDNSGELDNCISGNFIVDDVTFGAEWAVGTKSMSHKTLGSYSDVAGLRNIAINVNDFAWYDSEVIQTGAGVIEISLPLEVLGLMTGTHTIAIFALISDWSGFSYSNQSFPEGINSNNIPDVIQITIWK